LRVLRLVSRVGGLILRLRGGVTGLFRLGLGPSRSVVRGVRALFGMLGSGLRLLSRFVGAL
jgi:hypothetical protein